MTDVTAPTHFRLISTFKAIGPYLREAECQPGNYLFDCLSVCVNDKKSPELREFWGWWLELAHDEQSLVANYSFGKYDEKGQWLDEALPTKARAEVQRTLDEFHDKLVLAAQDKYNLVILLHNDSVELA